LLLCFFFFFQAEDGIRDIGVTGVQTCALPISLLQNVSNAALIVLGSELPFADPQRQRAAFFGQMTAMRT